jgi:hypothetical protein
MKTRSGTDAIGDGTDAIGDGTDAIGDGTDAIGDGTDAIGAVISIDIWYLVFGIYINLPKQSAHIFFRMQPNTFGQWLTGSTAP